MVSGGKKLRLAALLGAGAILVVLAAVGAWTAFQVLAPYQGYAEPEKFVLIERGSSVREIGRRLESEGVIRSSSVFRIYLRLRYGDPSLKAGEYKFEGPQPLAEVAEMLEQGRIYYHRLTVPEGYSLEEIVSALAATGLGGGERFEQAVRRTEWIEDVDPEANDLEGYLFPETYFFTRGMSEEQMVGRMLGSFRRIWTEERRQRAQERGMNTREVVTLASLIEKETGRAEERRLVSAVFHNRLERNIPLGCDPTVVYAAKLAGQFDGVIRQSDLNRDSPYNTYRYPGLPPGPIASPGAASIDAALDPAQVDYLFFVSRNDGSHYFSNNYRDHSRAVQRYQRSGRNSPRTEAGEDDHP